MDAETEIKVSPDAAFKTLGLGLRPARHDPGRRRRRAGRAPPPQTLTLPSQGVSCPQLLVCVDERSCDIDSVQSDVLGTGCRILGPRALDHKRVVGVGKA